MTSRRDFLERVGASALIASIPATPALAHALTSSHEPGTPTHAEDWDLSWVSRVNGKYRACFDVPEIDSGYGVWRASIWVNQYSEVLEVKPQDCSPVLVLRHNGIALAMTQAFWDRYELAKKNTVVHPVTQQGTDRNPALLSSTRNEAPADVDAFALDKYLARGGVALACNLALDDMVAIVAKQDGISSEAARKIALAGLVPGVILQPSGVFAAIRAQDAGCKYLRAS